MSVLIKGMDKPKSCWDCPMVSGYELSDDRKAVYSTVRCRLLNKKRNVGEAIDPNCPLIELPPHGDLIDRSKLAWTPIDITDLPFGECLPVYLKEDVDSAPIVVESEE